MRRRRDHGLILRLSQVEQTVHDAWVQRLFGNLFCQSLAHFERFSTVNRRLNLSQLWHLVRVELSQAERRLVVDAVEFERLLFLLSLRERLEASHVLKTVADALHQALARTGVLLVSVPSDPYAS